MACHDGEDRMTSFDHNTTLFHLEGRHIQTACVECHIDGQFEDTPLECVSCHLEPEVHAGLFSLDCAACHTAVNWSAMTWLEGMVFDHYEQTNFSLNRHLTNYSGDSLSCLDCHTSDDGIKVDFDIEFCITCHQLETPVYMQDHLAEFGIECVTCHDGVDRMANFNHDDFFVLDGSHVEISCEDCHQDKVFHDTPSACSECHIEPDIHAGYFGLHCESCHGTIAWAPAKMQSHTFPLDHGEEGLIDCETCHATRYTEYTCYGCHEHQPEDILNEHREEGISQTELVDCMACHPDGLEHDD